MAKPTSENQRRRIQSKNSPLKDEQYARLMAEAKAPYRGLRKFVYVSFGASGFIGAVIFLAKLLAGREIASTLPNFAFQVGVVALMIWLFRWENSNESRSSGVQKSRSSEVKSQKR